MEHLNDIIKYAISLEEEAIDYYETMSRKASKSEIQKVFLEMVAQEKGHKAKLQRVIEKQDYTEKVHYTPDDDLKLSHYIKGVDENKANVNYEEAMIIAMKREQKSLELYNSLEKQVENPELKELFRFLAKEEAKHKSLFENRFDDLL
ncbi:MAG: ferritin family protein [Proteobacteria bacterium]|nr:ferritin family protein [Pseudomonadota bacterium]